MAENKRFPTDEGAWTPSTIYEIGPPQELAYESFDLAQGTDGVDEAAVQDSLKRGGSSFGQRIVAGIAGAMRNVFTRNTIPPVQIEPVFNPIQTGLEEALQPMFNDIDSAIADVEARREALAAAMAAQDKIIDNLKEADANIRTLIDGTDGINDTLDKIQVEMATKVSDQSQIINDVTSLLNNFDLAVANSAPTGEQRSQIDRLNLALWGNQNTINSDNLSKWEGQGMLNRLQEEMWNEQGVINQSVQAFADEQKIVNQANKDNDEALAKSIIDLRTAIAEQSQYISRTILLPSKVTSAYDSYISVSRTAAFTQTVTITALGDWTGNIIVEGVNGSDIYSKEYSAIPTSGADPRSISFNNMNYLYPAQVTYWVSQDRMKTQENALKASVVPVRSDWFELTDLRFVVPESNWHTFFFVATWGAATYHDYYGVKITRVRNGQETTLAVTGPRRKLGPLFPNGDGIRSMTVKYEAGSGAFMPGDEIRFEVSTTGEKTSQRQIISAKSIIAWRSKTE